MTFGRLFALTLILLAVELPFNGVFAQDVGSYPAVDSAYADIEPGHTTYQPISWMQNQAGNPAQPAQQPQPALRPNPPAPANPLANMQNRRPALARLSRAPDLFGDSYTPLTVGIIGAHFTNLGNTDSIVRGNYEANIPVGAGTRRFKNEQTRALPTDRVIFVYNHFHNALELKQFDAGRVQSDVKNVDQFTAGFEKTFDEGQWSVEMRMPFAGNSDLAVAGIAINNGNVGNLAIALKRLIYSSNDVAIAAGVAVTAPTGSDSEFIINNGDAQVAIENDAVHLLPYLGFQWTPNESWFFHAFAQVDVAANSNGVTYSNPGSFPQSLSGSVTEQSLMYLDASLGYWWYRSDEDEGLTGLASVLEFHYTTALNEAKSSNIGGANFFTVGNGLNRFDVVNMTVGVHTEWWRHTSLRTALVVPLGNEEDRFFDSEIQVSLIRRF